MTCPNCGAPAAENRRFCGKCGTALAPPAPPAAAAPMSPAGAPPTAWGSTASPSVPPPPPPDTPPAAPDPFAPPDLSAPPGYAAPPPYPAPPYPAPPYPAPPYGGPPPYPPPGAWPGPANPYAGPSTNGLAITSLVLGLVGPFTCGIGSVVAIVLGFVSRDQVKRSWGHQTGSGMATAGIVLGFLGAALWLFVMIVAVVDSAGSTG
jgi:hypothetical protein